ncbi:hypothetical protein PVAND_002000 [Polypedilum vanderplanki]|uniref:Uncharacterized protein n=1 Tax=Polypedilum vanderplanki TaxID=319348 RepID=A0A9J6BPM8_POLVA|nr:hypothetical protein PVAND_002000 [Polypedilum vanderplanki]
MKTLWFEIFITLLIFKTATLFTISCSYRFRKFVAIGEVYECLASNIPILSGNTITGVSGTHSSGWNNNDVTSLDIRGGRTLSFIPRGATDFFPNIIALLIQDTTMDTLWGNEFNEFRKIKYLSITYGQLTTIPSRFFENLPNIIYIYINSNLIKYTGYDLFAPLDINKLQGLYFS